MKPKKEKIVPRIISQCPNCKTVVMVEVDGRTKYIQTHVVFPTAPKEQCYPCKVRAEELSQKKSVKPSRRRKIKVVP